LIHEEIKYCKNCNSILNIKNKRDLVRKKFCSRSCNGTFNGKKRMEDPGFLIKFIQSSNNNESKSKKGHKKESHPRWIGREKRNCMNCGYLFETRKNTGRKYCNNKCSLEKIHSDLLGKNRIDRIKHECIICGCFFERPKNYKSPAKYCSRKCHCIGIVKFSNKKSTNIERILENIIIDIGLSYETQYVIKNISIADFKIDNTLIFADGDYWHNLPGRREKDLIQTKKLKETGYRVIRFDGSLIENSPELIIEKIIKELC